jgi:hypothetical protein
VVGFGYVHVHKIWALLKQPKDKYAQHVLHVTRTAFINETPTAPNKPCYVTSQKGTRYRTNVQSRRNVLTAKLYWAPWTSVELFAWFTLSHISPQANTSQAVVWPFSRKRLKYPR